MYCLSYRSVFQKDVKVQLYIFSVHAYIDTRGVFLFKLWCIPMKL